MLTVHLQMTLEEQFDSRVSAFLRRSGLSPTALGRKALGDPGLMRQIALGRSLSLRTADRVLAFIAAHGGLDAGAAPTPPRPRRRRQPAARAKNTSGSGPTTDRSKEPVARAPIRLLRLPEVMARTGLSRTTIYVWRKEGRFPQPVLLGTRTLAWIESELEEWMREQIAKSRGGTEVAVHQPKRAVEKR